MIRAATILQLLLGNIGRPGGGILALRGHATIQGSTDIPTLYNLLPGYLNTPERPQERTTRWPTTSRPRSARRATGSTSPSSSSACSRPGTATRRRRRTTSATTGCPRTSATTRTCRCSWPWPRGRSRGSWRWARTRPSAARTPATSARRWRSSTGWSSATSTRPRRRPSGRTAPRSQSGELKPEEIATEVFLLPAAATAEMDGTYTNTQRLIQWHDRAADPPGDARSDLWFTVHLGLRLKALYADSTLDARPADPGAHLGLHRPRGERGLEGQGRALGRAGPQGDQRLLRRRPASP